uniref:CHK domain-containing protein n=1 Tax=Rhabditophanes sp. KR3021 TaxID=114890 RepID=A0AC35UAW8_9BILA
MEALFASKDMLAANINGTNTSMSWVIDSLEKNSLSFRQARGQAKVSKIDNIDISDKKGFNSKVYKTTITFDDINNNPYVCILKIPGTGDLKALIDEVTNDEPSSDDEHISVNTTIKMHNREVLFYEHYSGDIKGLHIPKCFGAKEWIFNKQEGAILMEYKDSNQFSHAKYFDTLTIEQAQSVMDQIFILQSHFLTLPDQSWKEKFPTVVTALDFIAIKDFFLPNFENIKKLTDPALWKDTEQDILALASHYFDAGTYIFKDLPYEEDNQSVFVEADMWINNFLFDNTSKDVTLLDFQVSHCGNIGYDLCDILITNCNYDTRKALEKTLPQYYQKLKQEVESKACTFNLTYEKFIQNYDISLIVRALIKCMAMEMIYALNEVPKEGGDAYWDQMKKDQAFYTLSGLNDAVEGARKHKPEWLILKE